MEIVRDALSCAGLAVVSAAAVATAANPITAAGIVGIVAAGAAGNLAHGIWKMIDRAGAAKFLRGWRGIDENHVVVQALRKSHIEALRAVLKTFTATAARAPNRLELEAFADRVEEFIKVEWKEAERLGFYRQGSLTSAEYQIRRSVLGALPMNFDAALASRRQQSREGGPEDDFERLREALIQGALKEIKIRTLPEGSRVPTLFEAIFLGTNVPNSWFDYFIREAADRLKNEDAFAAIWNAEQVAYATELLREVTARLDRLERIVGAPLRTGAASLAKFKAAIRNRPTELLIARYRVIPYIDRDGLLEDALAWARSTESPAPQGRLYAAPGGFGKTRFAIEMILTLAAEGWNATFVSSRDDPTAGALSDLMSQDEAVGTFLVLDYAESQIVLLKRIADAAAASTGSAPIRILALARSREGWWEGTHSDGVMPLVFDPAPVHLIERSLNAAERDEFFAVATDAFRAALAEIGLPTPEVASPDIAGQAYDRPLTVAMAAFLRARGIVPDPTESIFQRIFIEERRHWHRQLRAESDNDPAVESLHRAATQITLVQGATREGAQALIAADPRSREYGRPAQDVCLTTLERIYGVASDGTTFLRPIEPDLLGEHAAMAALARDTDGLIDATFSTALAGEPLFAQDVAAMATVLERATRSEHDARTRRAATIAVARLCNCASSLDGVQARHVEASLPRFSVPLTGLRVAVARRVLETAEDEAEEARALNNLATFLSETGDRQGALIPARRAAEIYEKLAQDNPAAYLPDLAMSLNNLANRLSETGDRQGALIPARRAAEIYEKLAQDNPAAYLPDLAGSLNNLANRLSETGDRQGALSPARRAAEIYEKLAQDNPAAYLPDLAMSLNNLANRLSETGDRQGALIPARRAAEIDEKLAQDNPAAYLPDLAMSLNNLANRLSETGDRQGALIPARRAAEIREKLAQDNPAAYLPDLAGSLNNLANRLSETADRQGALIPARRAAEIYEKLAQDNPAAYLPDLAMSLNNLANRLSETGDRQGALIPARRAAEIYEKLAQDNPAAYLPDLAMSLLMLGGVLKAADDRAGAISAYADALRSFRTCLESAPQRFEPYLAMTAERLSDVLAEAGRAEETEATLRAILGDELFEALRSARRPKA